eukprot:m.168340 g.168340  ORF g.168340 m.168340 type:complete len:622 (-) comp18202_c0_seq1:207-2072(-)
MSSDQNRFESCLATLLTSAGTDLEICSYISSLLFESGDSQDDTDCREIVTDILGSASPEGTNITALVDNIWHEFEVLTTTGGVVDKDDTDSSGGQVKTHCAPQVHKIKDTSLSLIVSEESISTTQKNISKCSITDDRTSTSHSSEEYTQFTEHPGSDRVPRHDGTATPVSNTISETEHRMTELAQLLQNFTETEMMTLRSLSDAELGTALWILIGDDSAVSGSKNGLVIGSRAYREPCKYFMQSQCFRSDCRYAHDVSEIPCKFYLNGWCQNGSDCLFLHDDSNTWVVTQAIQMIKDGSWDGIAEELIHARQHQHILSSPDFENHDAFPTLGMDKSVEESRVRGGDLGGRKTDSISQTDNIADRIKLGSLKKMFPVVWDADLKRHFADASNILDAAVLTLQEEFPGAYVHPTPEHAMRGTQSNIPPSYVRRKKGATPVQEVQWVRTGTVLGIEYDTYRADAIKHAEARNRYFQEARSAFLRGDKKGAKELSRRGRHHDACMREQHALAADSLFQSRNGGAASRNPDNVVDLHGLHVDEALIYLERTLNTLSHSTRLSQVPQHQYCYVVTGTGHHSSHKHLGNRQQQRLEPAVTKYLIDNGYRWRKVRQKGDLHGGMLEVTL